MRGWSRPEVYVFSFSAVPDLLSQWRAYCPDGAGVAIGFPKALINRRAAVHGFDFAPCIYNPRQQAEAVVSILREADVAWNNAGKTTDRKSTRLNSSHVAISYAVFCLKK